MKRKTGVPREEWMEYSTCFTRSLEEVREVWFEDTMDILNEVSRERGFVTVDAARMFLGGEVELILKSFQLYLASVLIAGRDYVSQADYDMFIDILDAQVCGSDYEECMEYFETLNGQETTEEGKKYIADMVVSSISEKPFNEYQMNLLVDMIQLLGALTLAITAEIFNDKKTSKEFREKVDALFGIDDASEQFVEE
jgi:hypothetical protein